MMICRKLCPFAVTANITTVRAFHANNSGLRGSAAIRGIPSSVIDIYKALEYECPEEVASAADSRDVAKAVNGANDRDSLMSLGMSKSMALKIIKNRERHRRDFERVEQFLDLDQMTTKKLEREVGKMVMKIKEEEVLKSETQADLEKRTTENPESEEAKTGSKIEKKLQRMITPAVDPDIWENVNTVMGIKLTLESLSYAKMTKDMELLDWNVIKMMGRSAGKSRANFEFPHILNAANTATVGIPPADAYVLEAPPIILGQRDLMMQLKVHTMRMQSTVAALLSQRFTQAHRVYEVRYGLREALLGSEAIGGGQTGLRFRAEKWLKEDEPMSPIYPSMKVQMSERSEQGLIDVLDHYLLEKDKKEQVKLDHNQTIVSIFLGVAFLNLGTCFLCHCQTLIGKWYFIYNFFIPIAVGDCPCDSGICSTRQLTKEGQE